MVSERTPLPTLYSTTAADLDLAVERLRDLCSQHLGAGESVSQDLLGELVDEAREVTRLAVRWVAVAECVEGAGG
jgi:hypothetical protein